MMQFYGIPSQSATAELQEFLSGLRREEIEEVATVRNARLWLPAAGKRKEALAELAGELASPASVLGAMFNLNRRELALLNLLWRRSSDVAEQGMVSFFAPVLDREQLQRVVEELRLQALLLPDGRERYRVPEAVRSALLGRLGPSRPASSLFEPLKSDVLIRICATLGLNSANNKAARAAAIATALATQGRVRDMLAQLSDEERQLLNGIAAFGGQIDPHSLQQRFPAYVPASSYSSYGRIPALTGVAPRTSTPVLSLQAKALLVAYPPDWASQLVIPDEVLACMQPEPALDAADFVEPPFEPADGALPAGTQPAPVLDLVEVLAYVDELEPALTQKGLFAKPDSKRLARRLSVPETEYADLLFTLAFDVGGLSGEGSLHVLKESATVWLRQEDAEQRVALFNAWAALSDWYDPLPEPYPRTTRHGSAVAIRGFALAPFMELPVEGATLSSVTARLRFQSPRLFDSATALSSLGDAMAPPERWVAGVMRTLVWLGFVEPLVLPARPGVAAVTVGVQPTPLGRALMQADETARAAVKVPRSDRIIVQPTLDILTPPNIDPVLYYDLRAVTDLSSSRGMRTLALTPESLRRSLDGTLTPARIRALLAEHSDAPLPNTLETLLSDVASRHGRVRVGEAEFYITVDDPSLLEEIKADRRTAGLILRTIAPTVAIVNGLSLDKVLGQLRSAGHMPVSDIDPADAGAARGLHIVGRDGPAAGAGRKTPSLQKATTPATILNVLAEAFSLERHAEIEYRSRNKGVVTPKVRTVDVYSIDSETAYLFDHLTLSDREFRLSRIGWARLLDTPSCDESRLFF
jgi:hypothetical protein